MSREIVFKVWDNVNYMSSPFTLQDLQLKKVQFTEDSKVLQFTGVYDEKGVAIYEGDIVKNLDGDLRKIVYCVFGFEMRLLTGERDSNNTTWYFRIEVVGNEFQNPELISK